MGKHSALEFPRRGASIVGNLELIRDQSQTSAHNNWQADTIYAGAVAALMHEPRTDPRPRLRDNIRCGGGHPENPRPPPSLCFLFFFFGTRC